ncbi:MAG TPA: ATP-binding protein, partial [Anaerolineales bacterium]|nr:ATP-binding protein [Anaerolineales bacterium]
MKDQLTVSDLDKLLAGGMRPAFHWFPDDVQVGRLAAVLAAMANEQGGTVLIGVSPRAGKVQGVYDAEETLDRVFQAALLVDPPLVLPVPRLHSVGDKRLLWVTVPAGLPNVYALDGRYLGRDGAQSNPLSARRLRQLLIERGVVQIESLVPPCAETGDLDWDQVGAYAETLDWPADESLEELLVRRGCLKIVGERRCPSYAGLLLFGRHPQTWAPSAVILAARFTGETFSDEFFKQEIRGTLPQQLRQAEAFVRDNLPNHAEVSGWQRQETGSYPLAAVRELLVNAVAHRDYNQQGDVIHLNLFSNRIEVHSPGGLPGPVTLENLLQARFSRNAVLVQALSDLGFVERLGYGLDRVVSAMRAGELPPP